MNAHHDDDHRESGVRRRREVNASLISALSSVREHLTRANEAATELQPPIQQALREIDHTLTLLNASRFHRLFTTWGPLCYLFIATFIESVFIWLYCRWHGVEVVPWRFWDIYKPENIAILSKLSFVNGPEPMSIIAEVLMWSSLGVWVQRCFGMPRRYRFQRIQPAYDISVYMGTLVRNTSVAAIIITLLSVSKFSVFDTDVQTFPATAGLSFILGFFGDDAYRVLVTLKNKLLGSLADRDSKDDQDDLGQRD